MQAPGRTRRRSSTKRENTPACRAKALAKRAGVPVSTVSRIEESELDPTTTMRRRLPAAAGRTLDFATGVVPPESFAALTDARSTSTAGQKINGREVLHERGHP